MQVLLQPVPNSWVKISSVRHWRLNHWKCMPPQMNNFWALENPTWCKIWKRKRVEGAEKCAFGIKGKEFQPNLLKILIDLTGKPDAGDWQSLCGHRYLCDSEWSALCVWTRVPVVHKSLIKKEELHNLESLHLPFERRIVSFCHSPPFSEKSP